MTSKLTNIQRITWFHSTVPHYAGWIFKLDLQADRVVTHIRSVYNSIPAFSPSRLITKLRLAKPGCGTSRRVNQAEVTPWANPFPAGNPLPYLHVHSIIPSSLLPKLDYPTHVSVMFYGQCDVPVAHPSLFPRGSVWQNI